MESEYLNNDKQCGNREYLHTNFTDQNKNNL